MPVQINEVRAEVEPPQGSQSQPEAPTPPRPTERKPREILREMRRVHKRQARLKAD